MLREKRNTVFLKFCMVCLLITLLVATFSSAIIESNQIRMDSPTHRYDSTNILGHCPCDFLPHSCRKSKLQSTQIALYWRVPP